MYDEYDFTLEDAIDAVDEYIATKIYESNDFTPYETNHKTKSPEFRYVSMNINDKDAKKYIASDKYTKKYLDYIKKNTGEILVNTDDDELIGYIFVGKTKDKGIISTLNVNKPYRGYGFGHKLLMDAIHKYGAIDLVCDTRNKTAMDMYKRVGFVPIGYGNKGKQEYYMKLKSKLTDEDKPFNECAITLEDTINIIREYLDQVICESTSQLYD